MIVCLILFEIFLVSILLFKAGAQDTFNVLRTQLDNNVVGK